MRHRSPAGRSRDREHDARADRPRGAKHESQANRSRGTSGSISELCERVLKKAILRRAVGRIPGTPLRPRALDATERKEASVDCQSSVGRKLDRASATCYHRAPTAPGAGQRMRDVLSGLGRSCDETNQLMIMNVPGRWIADPSNPPPSVQLASAPISRERLLAVRSADAAFRFRGE